MINHPLPHRTSRFRQILHTPIRLHLPGRSGLFPRLAPRLRARPEGGKRTLHPADTAIDDTPEEVALGEVIEQAVASCSRIARYHSCDVAVNHNPSDDRLRALPHPLHQLIATLIRNAIAHSSDRQRVAVTTTMTDYCVSIAVHHPALIDLESQKRIRAVIEEAGDLPDDTGYSDAIRLVRRLHGLLDFRSAPFRGSEFIVKIPRYRARRPAAPSSQWAA